MAARKESYKGYQIEIEQDECPPSPRDEDTFGTLVLSHKRYDLPHECDLIEDNYRDADQVERALRKHYGATLILPVWGYDHSGFFLKAGDRTYPFDCPWDSGLLGFIFTTHKKMVEWFGANNQHTRRKATAMLEQEVATYSSYSNGDVWGYIVSDEEGHEVDDGSVWGYYDVDEAIQAAEAFINAHVAQQCERV